MSSKGQGIGLIGLLNSLEKWTCKGSGPPSRIYKHDLRSRLYEIAAIILVSVKMPLWGLSPIPCLAKGNLVSLTPAEV